MPGQTLGAANRQYDLLMFNIHPGTESGSTVVYEDDGISVDYLNDQFVQTTASFTRSGADFTFTISSSGSYSSFPAQRVYMLQLFNSMPAATVSVNGQPATYSPDGGLNTWHYFGDAVSLIVESPVLSTSATNKIVITFAGAPGQESMLAGILGGISHAQLCKSYLDDDWATPGSSSVQGQELMNVAATGSLLSVLANSDITSFMNVVKNFTTAFAAAVTEVNNSNVDPVRLPHCQALLSSAFGQ